MLNLCRRGFDFLLCLRQLFSKSYNFTIGFTELGLELGDSWGELLKFGLELSVVFLERDIFLSQLIELFLMSGRLWLSFYRVTNLCLHTIKSTLRLFTSASNCDSWALSIFYPFYFLMAYYLSCLISDYFFWHYSSSISSMCLHYYL